MWNIRSGKVLQNCALQVQYDPSRDASTPDGRCLAIETGNPRNLRDHKVYEASYDALGQKMRSILWGSTDAVHAHGLRKVLSSEGRYVIQVSDLPGNKNGQFVIYRTVRLWDALTGHEFWHLADSAITITGGPAIQTLAFSSDSKHVIEIRGNDASHCKPEHPGCQILMRDTKTGKIERRIANSDKSAWHQVMLSADDRILLAVGGSRPQSSIDNDTGTIYAWDVKTGRLLWKAHEPGLVPQAFAFSPNGKTFACACEDTDRPGISFPGGGTVSRVGGKVALWNLGNGKLLRTFTAETLPSDISVRLQNATSSLSQFVTRKSGSPRLAADVSSPFSAVAFSPDGHLLAAGDKNGTIKVWPVP